MQIVKMGTILMLVTVLAAGALSVINRVTKPMIEAIERQKKIDSLNEVLPGAVAGVIEPVLRDGKELYFRGFADTEKRELIGYAVQAEGAGYSSTIKSMIGIKLDGSIGRVKIMSQKETPGLGTKVVAEGNYQGKRMPWSAQLHGLKTGALAVDKDGGEISAIAGATISSRAVVAAVRTSLIALEKELSGFAVPVDTRSAREDK